MNNRQLVFLESFPPISSSRIQSLKSDISMGDSYFLILDGFRIGPFLCIGRMDHIEMLLESRGIRIAIQGGGV